MKDEIIKKIVAIGPESTGKSTLCEELAEHFSTLWCPEYAREYLLTYGKEYSYNDLLTIAKGQLRMEDEYLKKVKSKNAETMARIKEPKHAEYEFNAKFRTQNSKQKTQNTNFLFIDTDMYVMKVWCEYVFGMCHQFILDQIAERKYDLYLLCNIDLPWVPDELREYPEEAPRKELYQIYKNILIEQQTPWIEISGDHKQRFQKAINAVEKYLL